MRSWLLRKLRARSRARPRIDAAMRSDCQRITSSPGCTAALRRTSPASHAFLLAKRTAIVAPAECPTTVSTLSVDARGTAKPHERRFRVTCLQVEPGAKVVATRFADAALVVPERRNTMRSERRRDRVRDVEYLLGHVRVAIQRPRSAQDERRGKGLAEVGITSSPTSSTSSSVVNTSRSVAIRT